MITSINFYSTYLTTEKFPKMIARFDIFVMNYRLRQAIKLNGLSATCTLFTPFPIIPWQDYLPAIFGTSTIYLYYLLCRANANVSSITIFNLSYTDEGLVRVSNLINAFRAPVCAH